MKNVFLALVTGFISLSAGLAQASDLTDAYIQCSLTERGPRLTDERQIVSVLAPLRDGRFEFNETVQQRTQSGQLANVLVRVSLERVNHLVVKGEATLFNPFKASFETIPLSGLKDGEGNGYIFINLRGSLPNVPLTNVSFGCAQVALSSIIDAIEGAEGVRILE